MLKDLSAGVIDTQALGTQTDGTHTAINTTCNWELFEDDRSYYLCVERPGVQKENIHVTIAQGTMIIQGTMVRQTTRATNATCLVAQSITGSFRFKFSLTPVVENLDIKQVTSVYDNGVLDDFMGLSVIINMTCWQI